MTHSTEVKVPPFPLEHRASGLLLHVTSLPSPYGIGDLGPSAFSWVNLLHDAGQRWWQSLPLGPTGYGNSPYQPMSSFAGNALVISPQSLIADGLLREEDCESNFPSGFVDYDAVIPFKTRLLQVAWKHFKSENRTDLRAEFDEFRNKHEHWLSDYALFRALKAKYNGAYYLDWPDDIVQRRPDALAAARRELADEIEQVSFAQFLLFRQGDRLKTYAHSKGVRLIGDLPFFVSPDSSDVRIRSYFFSMSAAGHASSQEFLPTTSVRKDNCGATPFTTGMHFERAVIGGRLTEYVLCLRTWMRFASTTSADLRPPGMCPRTRQPL